MGAHGKSRPYVLLIFIGIFFQVWAGYLILRGLHGHDVFTNQISYMGGSIGMVVLGLGLLLLVFDIIGGLMNFLSREEGKDNEIVLVERKLLLNLFSLEAIALLCVAIVFSLVELVVLVGRKVIWRPIHRQLRVKPAPSQPLS
jgi:hypothetical protein